MTVSCREQVVRPSPPEGVALRVMKASDLPHVRALHRNLLPVSYPVAFFVQLLINPRQLCLVATDGSAIIGFASASMSSSQQECSDIPRSHITLLTLGVLPTYQRRRIGQALVHGVIQRLGASCAAAARPTSSDHIPDPDSKISVLVRVHVAQSNAAGKRFYTHLGMMDQRGRDDPRLCFGPASWMSVMEGVLCI